MSIVRFSIRFLKYFFGFLLLFFFLLSSDYLLEEGKGKIVQKLERDVGDKTEPFLQTHEGAEVHVSYPFWRMAKVGDALFKKKWTFTFYLNEQPYSEFSEFFPFLAVAAPVLALFFAIKESL